MHPQLLPWTILLLLCTTAVGRAAVVEAEAAEAAAVVAAQLRSLAQPREASERPKKEP
jgi:hypothetical protein